MGTPAIFVGRWKRWQMTILFVQISQLLGTFLNHPEDHNCLVCGFYAIFHRAKCTQLIRRVHPSTFRRSPDTAMACALGGPESSLLRPEKRHGSMQGHSFGATVKDPGEDFQLSQS